MSEKMGRRDFNWILLAGGGLAALSLVPGCSTKETQRKIPEFVITNNRKITQIINVDLLAGQETGIHSIYFYPSDDFNKINVTLDRKPDTDYSLNTINPQTDYPRHGFVPFDSRFNIEKALVYLRHQHQVRTPPPYTEKEAAEHLQMTSALAQNDPGVSLRYETPNPNTAYMYVLYSGGFYTVNGNIPPPTILRAKFVFTKAGQQQEISPPQPQQF